MGALCFECRKCHFQESGCNIEKWMNRRSQHKEPIEGIQVWLLLAQATANFRARKWMDHGSMGFITTYLIRYYPEISFTFQNKFEFFLEHRVIFFKIKWNFTNLKKKAKWIGYLVTIIDPHYIPLQNEPSPILVEEPCVLSAGNVSFQESGCNIEKWMNRRHTSMVIAWISK